MDEKPKRERWVVVIADLLIRLVVGVAVPVAIFCVGNRYTTQRDRSDREQRNLDRVSSLLKSMASGDQQERLLSDRLHQVF
jgi:hypothetical protein